MSEQYYDVEVYYKKVTFVRVYAANKKEAKVKARGYAPESNESVKKYFEVLGEDCYIEGSWQPTDDITAKGQIEQYDWSDYDECIKTVDGQVIHCKKHS